MDSSQELSSRTSFRRTDSFSEDESSGIESMKQKINDACEFITQTEESLIDLSAKFRRYRARIRKEKQELDSFESNLSNIESKVIIQKINEAKIRSAQSKQELIVLKGEMKKLLAKKFIEEIPI
jgi:hypothetical protein